MDKTKKLIIDLNFLSIDEKQSWWVSHQEGCKYKNVEKKGDIEFNWFHFTKQDIWMCKVYDYDQHRRGEGIIKDILFLKEKENLTKYYK